MQAAIDQFRTNIERVRNLGAIYKALKSQTTGALDLSDILRAELVMGLSAFDHYIHELVRLGMIEVYNGHRVKPPAFLRFQVALDNVIQGIANPTDDSWLEDQINSRHSYQSFQHPDKVAEAIRLISDVQLWNEVSQRLGITAQQTKQKLILIFDRRNKIAHEADMDPSFPGKRWPIDETLADDAIDFIELLAKTVYIVVS
jgi:hypothetical protein